MFFCPSSGIKVHKDEKPVVITCFCSIVFSETAAQVLIMFCLFSVHVGYIKTDAGMLVGQSSGEADVPACEEDACEAAVWLRIRVDCGVTTATTVTFVKLISTDS